MKKAKCLLMLLMAVVMMAMSPTRVWADDLTPLTTEKCNELGLDAATYIGYYAIGNANDLTWFRDKVNNDNSSYKEAKAVLTANIDMSSVCHAASEGVVKANWTPIGSSEGNPYKGTFDGNGKTVEGLYYDGDGSTIGFVGCLANGTVQNLTVNGSFRSTSVYGCIGGIAGQASGYITNCTNQTLIQGRTNVGGIAGKDNGSLTVTGCSNHKDVKGAYQIGVSGGVGGIIGTIEKGNSSTSISNCYNTGNIGDGIRIGGIIGHITATATVLNAYSAGTVTGNSDAYMGAFVGKIGTCYTTMGITQWINATAIFTNCYYDNTKCSLGYCSSSGNHNNKSGSDVSVTGKSTTAFASGEVAYLLNGSTSESPLAWYQKLGTSSDSSPVLMAASDGSNTVYYGYECESGVLTYANRELCADPNTAHDFTRPFGSSELAGVYVCDNGCGAMQVNGTPTYTRMMANKWGTIVLPFSVTIDSENQNFDFYTVSSVSSSELSLSKMTGTLAAGTPALIRMSEAAKNAENKYVLSLTAPSNSVSTTITNPTEVGGLTLTGTYAVAEVANGYIIGNDAFHNAATLKGNAELWKDSQGNAIAAGKRHVYCQPFRAYLAGTLSNQNGAPARLTIGTGIGDDTTALEAIEAITEGDATGTEPVEYFDMNGHRIDDLQQGVNIVKRGSKTYKVIIK